MDTIIIAGTIPTLWPLMRLFSGNIIKSLRNFAFDGDVQIVPDEEHRMGVPQLSDERPNRKAGPATRELEELDNMRTIITLTGGE